MSVSPMEVSNVANKYAARKMFDEGVAAYIKRTLKQVSTCFHEL